MPERVCRAKTDAGQNALSAGTRDAHAIFDLFGKFSGMVNFARPIYFSKIFRTVKTLAAFAAPVGTRGQKV